MDVGHLIQHLSRATAYPHPADRIELRQTHISVVFLAGAYAYKIKKPVNLGFLDFTTLETRHRVCLDEVRLNRRLAPSIYLDVVPVVAESPPRGGAATGLAIGGDGEALEWAVKMHRLPDDGALSSALARGELSTQTLVRVAERIAEFHRAAESGPEVAAMGKFEVVAGNARENFEQSTKEVGLTVSPQVFDELRALTESSLGRLRTLIDERARRCVPRDGHGDLRLEHIYFFPEQKAPDDLVIIDCVEYAERFRFADPVCDIAFTVMELLFAGRTEAARSLADAYFRASGDEEGRDVLPFYVAYRSVVRAKVRGFELREPEIPKERRAQSLARAKAHFLLALGVLAEPERRPAMVLVGGLPGTGKSTLARSLGERARLEVIRSDVVRKELAGLPPDQDAADLWQAGIYAQNWTERTYAECLKRAERLILEGKRVIIDASFSQEALRVPFLDAARALSVPVVFFVCQAEPERVRERLASRRGDASDADWKVYEKARAEWQAQGPSSSAVLVAIEAGQREAALDAALLALTDRGLC